MSLYLKNIATKLRQDILKMIYSAQSGHPGGSFSSIDLLTVLFFDGFLKLDAQHPDWLERDYFILSKGHAAPALYAVLGELGFFAKDEFFNLRQIDSLLQGHPVIKIPGVEATTGSLGQGVSMATGIAMGLKIDQKSNKVFTLLGDGEMQEGQVWEALMSAAHHHLGNLVAIVDVNGLQIDGATSSVMNSTPLDQKFQAFGWEVFTCDGHNYTEIGETLKQAIAVIDKPAVILAKTVKGKGVSFMENNAGWHGKAPNEAEFTQAMAELEMLI